MKFIGDEKNSSGNEFEKILSHTIVFNVFRVRSNISTKQNI